MHKQSLLLVLGLAACGPATEASSPEGTSSASADAPASATPEASAAPSTDASAAAPATAAPSASAAIKPEPPKTKAFALADFKVPLAIELPEDAKIEKSESKDGLGGALVDSKTVSLRVFKADAKVATPAAAKATLQKLKVKAVSKFLKEEADLLVYVRGESEIEGMLFKKEGGVTYVCQTRGSATKEEEIAASLSACRTLKKP